MHPFPTRLSRRTLLAHALFLLAAIGLLGACDRHSADDLPESYGHGSGHDKSYRAHKTDSRSGTNHFSDSKGLESEKTGKPAAEATAKPGGESDRMFQGN